MSDPNGQCLKSTKMPKTQEPQREEVILLLSSCVAGHVFIQTLWKWMLPQTKLKSGPCTTERGNKTKTKPIRVYTTQDFGL